MLEVLSEIPGTYATGVFNLQRAVSMLDRRYKWVGSFFADDLFEVSAKTEEARTRLLEVPSSYLNTIFCSTVSTFTYTALDPTSPEEPRGSLPSFMKIWLEYSQDSQEFLICYSDNAVEDFYKRVLRYPGAMNPVEIFSWVDKHNFSLESEFQERIVQTALELPGFSGARLSIDLDQSAILSCIRLASYNRLPGYGHSDTRHLLCFYLSLREILKNGPESNLYFLPVEEVVTSRFMSLFDDNNTVSHGYSHERAYSRAVKTAASMHGNGERNADRIHGIHGALFEAHCSLYPILLNAESVEERFAILDFFAEGCEAIGANSIDYDDIICAWQDNAIPWEAGGTLGVSLIAGYAKGREDTPTNRMKHLF